ncbi:MAG: Flp family type IVb pilin [Blastocatellia bacterium]
MSQKIKQFLTDESGQDMVEYSLVIVLLGTIALIYLTGMGLNVANILQKIGAKLELVSNQVS